MKNITIIFLCILSLVSLVGCATLENRFCPTKGINEQHQLYVEKGIYPSLRLDIKEIKWLPTSEYRPGRVDYFSNILLTSFVIIDLPISIVSDTLFLPLDVYRRNFPKK